MNSNRLQTRDKRSDKIAYNSNNQFEGGPEPRHHNHQLNIIILYSSLIKNHQG